MRPLEDLTREELIRYARHLMLPEVGYDGQRRLKAASVLVVGAGGLGSPAALYLAAAGVGELGLADFDNVALSNLQRQILHGTADIGRPKLESARDRLASINPDVHIRLHPDRVTSANALDLIRDYDVILDGTDNFETRYLINDACVLGGKPNAYGAIFRFEGQASVFAAPGGPCYRCLHPEPPPPGLVPNCAEAGVFGVLPGFIGTIQATEAIKLIAGLGEPLVGRLLVYDALRMSVRELKLRRDPDCPVCGTHPTIKELIDYDAFCGMTQQPGSGSGGPAHAAAGMPDRGEAASGVNISPEELRSRLDGGDAPRLLDVREPHEFEIARLPGAVLIPLGELFSRHTELDPGAEVVVYCHHGIRSASATAYLRSVGFAGARNLTGGIDAWSLRIDPATPRY